MCDLGGVCVTFWLVAKQSKSPAWSGGPGGSLDTAIVSFIVLLAAVVNGCGCGSSSSSGGGGGDGGGGMIPNIKLDH